MISLPAGATRTKGPDPFNVAVGSWTAFREPYTQSIQGTPPEINLDIVTYPNLTSASQASGRELLAEKRQLVATRELQKPSPAFAELTLQRRLRQILGLLPELKLNLDKPEGAALMVRLRHCLSETWKVRESLPKERVLVVSAIEEVIRAKKWRELTPAQIDVLRQVTAQATDSAFSRKGMAEIFRTLHKSGMDLYPASPVDEEPNGDE